MNVICGKDLLIPDISVVSSLATFLDGDLASPLNLAIEILSPGQTFIELTDKCNRRLRAGTEMCLIIWPEKRRAWMYSARGMDEVSEGSGLLFGSFHGEQLNTVETLPIADLWAELDRRGL